MNITMVVKMYFGSHLYGTATDDSDTDYKGVYLPSKEDILLGKIQKSLRFNTEPNMKNTSKDTDEELYSLHYFINLACENQTVAIDMLHAPESMLLAKNPIWEDIISNRHRFYTKNLTAFIGYATRQAAKYGIKGSRLNTAKEVVEFLKAFNGSERLSTVWDRLPTNKHAYYDKPGTKIRQYSVCGRALQETVKIKYAIDMLESYYTKFGKRAEEAALNENIDWKAMSHAIRAAIQVKYILLNQNIIFPLKEAGLLTDIKLGKLDYKTEAKPLLEELMEETKTLSEKSALPEVVDRDWWDAWLISTIEKYRF